MNAQVKTRRFGALSIATAIAAIAIPTAGAGGSASDSGLVARKLGSPDPREAVSKSNYSPGQVAGRLGSPDPRETVLASNTASVVASRLGSPDPRDTGIESLPADLRGAVRPDGPALRSTFDELAAEASQPSSAVATTLGSPDPRDTMLVEGQSRQTGNGFDWADFWIGLGFGIGLSAVLAGTILIAGVAVRGRSVAQPLA